MSRIGDETRAAYNLLLMPAPNTFLFSTSQHDEWNDVVLSLVSHIEQAALNGLHAFDRRDGKLTAGGNWTVPAATERAKFPPRFRFAQAATISTTSRACAGRSRTQEARPLV